LTRNNLDSSWRKDKKEFIDARLSKKTSNKDAGGYQERPDKLFVAELEAGAKKLTLWHMTLARMPRSCVQYL
jgi:hypothetical protein